MSAGGYSVDIVIRSSAPLCIKTEGHPPSAISFLVFLTSSQLLFSRKRRQLVSQTDGRVCKRVRLSVQLAVHGVKYRPSRHLYGAASLSCFLVVSRFARQPIDGGARPR